MQTLCGPYYQVLGQFTGKFPSEDELNHAAEVHRAIAPVAQAAGVKCAIEALNRFESHLLNTMEQAASYVKRVNHPNFGTMYDTFHANIEEKDPVGCIDTVWATGKLNHIHISENDRGTPGRGHCPIKQVDRQAEKARLRRLAHHRGLRQRAARPRCRHARLARFLPVARAGLHRGIQAHPRMPGTRA